MKKIIMFSRDPGGANVIGTVYLELSKYMNIILYGKEHAIMKYKEMNISNFISFPNYNNVDSTKLQIKKILKEEVPDLIITSTSVQDFTERLFWSVASELKIETYAILDNWVNYAARFSELTEEKDKSLGINSIKYLPTYIFAMDEYSKKIFIKSGIESDKVIVSGQPYFDYLRKKKSIKKDNGKKNMINILFLSQPYSRIYENMFWGYDEFSIINCLINALNELQKGCKQVRLIIKPHPRENIEELIQKYKQNISKNNIEVVIDDKNSLDELFSVSDIVTGMTTMGLIEAAVVDKSILSIQIGLKKEDIFMLSKIGRTKTILTYEELKHELFTLLVKSNTCCKKLDFSDLYGGTDKIIEQVMK